MNKKKINDFLILNIYGTRPQIIKSYTLNHYFSKNLSKKIRVINLNTSQHYDNELISILPTNTNMQTVKLDINSRNKDDQIITLSKMIRKIDQIIKKLNPKLGIIYGDTNSTLASSIALKRNKIEIIHIESGLRSKNIDMPEEQNRIIADRLSKYLISPNYESRRNLIKEGIKNENIYVFGDINYDVLNLMRNNIKKYEKNKLFSLNLKSKKYSLITIHREENSKIEILLNLINDLNSTDLNYIWPLHPKFKYIKKELQEKSKNIKFVQPFDLITSLIIQKNAKFIITDSGGVQRESYYLGIPTLIYREETEWSNMLIKNKNILSKKNIPVIVKKLINSKQEKIKNDIVSLKIINLINQIEKNFNSN